MRWRYARLAFQLPLLLLELWAIFDGLTGTQLAPRNVATTSVWLYRGLMLIVLAAVGNAFCAACPLMLTRGLTRRLERLLPRQFSWPPVLRNKALLMLLLVSYFLTTAAAWLAEGPGGVRSSPIPKHPPGEVAVLLTLRAAS